MPIIIIDTPISASKLWVTAIFYFYGGSCIETDSICNSLNIFAESGLNYTYKTLNCELLNTDCIVNIEYNDVLLETSSAINIQMRELTAAAIGISILINCSSSISSEFSSIFIPIYTDSKNQIFLGTTPTIVKFDFTSSVINYLDFYITK